MSGSSFASSSGSADSSSVASCSGDGKTSPCCVPFLDHDCSQHIKDNLAESSLFPHLRSISLNNSMFDCWEEICQLRIWPSLAELRMQSCPLFRVVYLHCERIKSNLWFFKNVFQFLVYVETDRTRASRIDDSASPKFASFERWRWY